MPPNHGADEQSSGHHGPRKPQNLNQSNEESGKDIDDFETVDHGDIDDSRPKGQGWAHDDLGLQRFGNNLEDPDEHEDEDEDSDEDEHAISSHPLIGMLAGRLGQQRRRGSSHAYDHLHPENQVLTIANVDDCVEVEQAFPEHERCSREKFEYRLSKCPELSLGLFTQPTKAEVENGAPKKRKLIAHIVATRTAAPCVTDESMDFPRDWKTNKSTVPKPGQDEPVGHQEIGGTVCVHSLAVRPEYQNMGLGAVLLKCYIQRMKDAKCAERLALLAHDHLEKFYGQFGFDNVGPSVCKFGGGGWNNMILEFSGIEDD